MELVENATAAEITEMRRLLGELRYKPGWTFDIRSSPALGVEAALCVVSPAVDSRRGGENYFGRGEPLPPGLAWDPERFYRFVFQVILDHEHHEAGEFFLVGNNRLFDPHAGGAPERICGVRAHQPSE